MNKKIVWKKYIFTSFLTMVILSLFTYSYLVYDTLVSYDVSFQKQEEISQDLVMYKIDELKQNSNYWNNARLCYQIATLYEQIYLFDLASRYYQRSIEKAPRNYYLPHFKLARLNMERGRYADAVFVINLIPQVNNKALKKEKGLFYQALSVKYANKNLNDEALDSIKRAMVYFKSSNTQLYKDAEAEHAYLLMKKSEQLIKNNKISEAIKTLELAEKENNSAELKYRLALLTYENDNKKAFKYFEKAQKINPSIINYDIYYKLILDLTDDAIKRNDKIDEKFYKLKATNLKRYVNSNFISSNDFKMENVTGNVETTFWGIKKYVNIKFDIYNNTNITYNNLYAQVVMNVNGKDISETINIDDIQHPILSNSKIKNINCKIDISKVLGEKSVIQGKIYLYKNPKFNKIEIGEFSF